MDCEVIETFYNVAAAVSMTNDLWFWNQHIECTKLTMSISLCQ